MRAEKNPSYSLYKNIKTMCKNIYNSIKTNDVTQLNYEATILQNVVSQNAISQNTISQNGGNKLRHILVGGVLSGEQQKQVDAIIKNINELKAMKDQKAQFSKQITEILSLLEIYISKKNDFTAQIADMEKTQNDKLSGDVTELVNSSLKTDTFDGIKQNISRLKDQLAILNKEIGLPEKDINEDHQIPFTSKLGFICNVYGNDCIKKHNVSSPNDAKVDETVSTEAISETETEETGK